MRASTVLLIKRCTLAFVNLCSQSDQMLVAKIATCTSVFQLCTLVAFYMTTKPNVSISHVFACYESECIAFTIVMTMLTYVHLSHLMLHFFNRVDSSRIDHNTMINHNSKAATEQEEAQKTGIAATWITASMLALTHKYPIGIFPHVTIATLCIGAYMLALFMRQYENIGKTRLSWFIFYIYLGAGMALLAWQYTHDNGAEWLAWFALTLVQCLINVQHAQT